MRRARHRPPLAPLRLRFKNDEDGLQLRTCRKLLTPQGLQLRVQRLSPTLRPIAVSNICDGLELATDDPRGLTVTGGLPYFGARFQ